MTPPTLYTPGPDAESPDVLLYAWPSVRSVYALLASAEALMRPRDIVAAWEQLSGEAQSVDTVNHALRELRRLELARPSPAGWSVRAPESPPTMIVLRFLTRR